MKLVTAFFRLIRWPNLVFIVVTQLLFYYCIILPITYGASSFSPFNYHEFYLVLLSLSSVFIAAAGYIINDYFDLSIDRVNKPDKLVVEKIIKRRWAILWHWLLSFAGILISFYLGFKEGEWLIALANTGCVLLLWFYSTTFKKKLLIGNVIISLLTAWVILVFFVYLASFPTSVVPGLHNHLFPFDISKLFKLTILYAGFAFIISLIREVIKDMEDMEGDAKYGCKTMPIVWGIPAAKVFTAVWLIVLIAALVIIQFYALHLHWWWSVSYAVILIITPLLWILKKLYAAQVPKDYHQLSTAVKLVMLAGILSMLFLKFMLNKIILASQSPRRKQLLEWAEIPFEIIVKETDESYPVDLTPSEIAIHIARNKALAIQQPNNITVPILAADTIVVLKNEIIGKPKSREDAIHILTKLAGNHHKVITGVVILHSNKEISFADITDVEFHPLTQTQIEFYVDKYKPYDKAGAYAIQEWIGVVGIKSINGDFYNVMGLPVSRVVQAVIPLISSF